MKDIVVGLGNPGEKYKNTRHNTGAILLEEFRVAQNFPEWEKEKYVNALISKGELQGKEILLVLPQTFMNESGKAVSALYKEGDRVTLIYDELDIPLGDMKMQYNRGSGGHRGVESVISSLGTKEFVRLRIGVSPKTFFGKIKKPKGENAVHNFILKKFSGGEMRTLMALSEKVNGAIEVLIKEGREKALSTIN